MFEFLRKLVAGEPNHPVGGVDAHWAGFCEKCKDLTSKASRGGFKVGGIEHCYECGHEQETKGINQREIDRMVLFSRFHWEKWPAIPYNWHELTEEQRWKVLDMNQKEQT